MVSITNDKTYEIRGLSTDKKPINDHIGNGSIFIEMDTSLIYTYSQDRKEWLVLDWNSGVSEEEFSDFKEDIEKEIEDIKDHSDVTDVVGTYAELMAYDTTKLTDSDIIEVLDDETQDHQNTMYKWHADTQIFELIGALGPYYTKSESDRKYINEIRLVEEDAGSQGRKGTIYAITYDYNNQTEIKTAITTYEQLREIILTPDPNTPDVTETEKTDGELTLTVIDDNGSPVKMTLEQLRQRFLASTAHDNTTIDDAQIGEFVYDEIVESEIEADWIDLNSQATWEAQYADPNSTLNKYYKWSDDVNKPYKEDLWNTVENRAANITDVRKVDGEYVYDENGNYIYDNCERCWLGAINAPGASYPWAVVELPIPFEGTIRFNYKDEAPVYPWGEADRTFTRGFAIASIPDELNMPELKINAEGVAEVPLNFGDLVVTLLPKLEEEE